MTNKVKRVAVAVLYEEIPKYDRMMFDGRTWRYYRGNILVFEMGHLEAFGLGKLELPIDIDIRVVEAETEKEAYSKVLEKFPYHVLQMKATLLEELVLEETTKGASA